MVWPTALMLGPGGFGDRERTLTIMQDPRSGPIAVLVLLLVLALQVSS
jgi:adenosylcobinamide-GDP ribazoletransferase